jgi:N,N'-diacetyllegionaminate synthase
MRKEKISVIAEIGWNHMGDMHLAKEMISAAAESGADYAKFQTWSVKNLKSGPWDSDGRLEIYKEAELSSDQHADLNDYCNSAGIKFLTSIFNIEDSLWLPDINNSAIKIPSHEVYNKELIISVDGKFDNIFISTGAAQWEEIEILPSLVKKSKLCLFHCVSSYPCLDRNVNLPRIKALKNINSSVGYSGHFFGIEDALAAASYGLDYIEKHFTIDRDLPGRDNKFAILPQQMKQLTSFLSASDNMNIDHGREHQDSELDIIQNYRGRWSK